MSKTLVLGASTNPSRYSFMAMERLRKHGIEVEAIGLRSGKVADVEIQTGTPALNNIDTITMYVGAQNQPPFYDYLISLNPRRVIFNPGAENPEFEAKLRENGVEVLTACTLVMLSVGNF
jgi:predicted CoA-binding protein